jgi:hypothetical protein
MLARDAALYFSQIWFVKADAFPDVIHVDLLLFLFTIYFFLSTLSRGLHRILVCLQDPQENHRSSAGPGFTKCVCSVSAISFCSGPFWLAWTRTTLSNVRAPRGENLVTRQYIYMPASCQQQAIPLHGHAVLTTTFQAFAITFKGWFLDRIGYDSKG